MNALSDLCRIVNPAKDGYGFAIFFESLVGNTLGMTMIDKPLAVYLKFQMDFSGASLDLDEQVWERLTDSDDFFDPQRFVTVCDDT